MHRSIQQRRDKEKLHIYIFCIDRWTNKILFCFNVYRTIDFCSRKQSACFSYWSVVVSRQASICAMFPFRYTKSMESTAPVCLRTQRQERRGRLICEMRPFRLDLHEFTCSINFEQQKMIISCFTVKVFRSDAKKQLDTLNDPLDLVTKIDRIQSSKFR